jgi:hypothetical protein
MTLVLLIILGCLLVALVVIRKRYKDENGLKGNLHIGFKPVFADAQGNRFYSIVCECGNKFSVRTGEVLVECECGNRNKLENVLNKFYGGLNKK